MLPPALIVTCGLVPVAVSVGFRRQKSSGVAKMQKQNARLKDPSDATVEGGMRRGVNVGNMKILKKPMKMRGGGAATKGLRISEKQG
jgi:hypothetical protein